MFENDKNYPRKMSQFLITIRTIPEKCRDCRMSYQYEWDISNLKTSTEFWCVTGYEHHKRSRQNRVFGLLRQLRESYSWKGEKKTIPPWRPPPPPPHSPWNRNCRFCLSLNLLPSTLMKKVNIKLKTTGWDNLKANTFRRFGLFVFSLKEKSFRL